MTGYSLGIDLGTTYTAAAVTVDGRAELLTLGQRAASMPTVVLVRDEGGFVVGEAAELRGAIEPNRVAREFKRRLGDPAPLVLGGTPYSAEVLMGVVLAHVRAVAVERMGGPPSAVAISHPAVYTQYRLDLLADAARRAGIDSPVFVSEPQAAALHYSQRGRLADGQTIAVYDLGGGTFDATVVHRSGDDFSVVGQPQGLERLGGIDFDVAVMEHVGDTVGEALQSADASDPAVMASLARLRAECRQAKELLSDADEITIPVVLPNVATSVELRRRHLERLVAGRIDETIASLAAAIRAAGMEEPAIDAIVLVGGCSRMPVVRQRLAARFDAPLLLDVDPEHAVALGAALHAAHHSPTVVAAEPRADTPAADTPAAETPASPPAASQPPSPPHGGPRGRPRRPLLIGAGLVAVAAVVVVVAVLVMGGDDAPGGGATGDCAQFLDLVDPESQSPDLVNLDLSGCSFAGADLAGAELLGVQMDGVDLRDADLTEANLSDASLVGADLEDATLTRATLFGADLSQATMQGALLGNAAAGDADFTGADMTGTNLADIDCARCDFSDAVLTGSDLGAANLAGATLSGAQMASVNLTDALADDTTTIGPAAGEVAVFNGSGLSGVAGQLATALGDSGYDAQALGNAEPTATSLIGCSGTEAGSDSRKLVLALAELAGLGAEELDFDDVVARIADGDVGDAVCVVIRGG